MRGDLGERRDTAHGASLPWNSFTRTRGAESNRANRIIVSPDNSVLITALPLEIDITLSTLIRCPGRNSVTRVLGNRVRNSSTLTLSGRTSVFSRRRAFAVDTTLAACGVVPRGEDISLETRFNGN